VAILRDVRKIEGVVFSADCNTRVRGDDHLSLLHSPMDGPRTGYVAGQMGLLIRARITVAY